MSEKDRLFELQCFVKKIDDSNSITIDYVQRRKYHEKLMYYYMGVAIASLDPEWMPFYTKNVGITYKARSSDLGKGIISLLQHANAS